MNIAQSPDAVRVYWLATGYHDTGSAFYLYFKTVSDTARTAAIYKSIDLFNDLIVQDKHDDWGSAFEADKVFPMALKAAGLITRFECLTQAQGLYLTRHADKCHNSTYNPMEEPLQAWQKYGQEWLQWFLIGEYTRKD